MKQITFASRNHQLTNTNTWTPDSQWLVYDVRPSGASFTGETIERVNVSTGEVEVIYRAKHGDVGFAFQKVHIRPLLNAETERERQARRAAIALNQGG